MGMEQTPIPNGEETIKDVLATFTEEQTNAVHEIIGRALTEGSDDDFDKETFAKVFDTLTEKQKTVVYAIVGLALTENSPVKGGNQNEEINVN